MELVAKRAFDICLSAVGLGIALPLIGACMLAIRLDSPGPIFYRQLRAGKHGQPFFIYKLRTMRIGADRSGLLVTALHDSRVTRVGRTIRKYKLDEIPQLLNVLVGHMSLVGPRPEALKYIDRYPQAARQKMLSVRPGLTDPVTLDLINEAELLSRSPDPERYYHEVLIPAKAEGYSKYVDTRTFLGDIWILALTLLRILHPKATD